jgi:hypothetical protein
LTRIRNVDTSVECGVQQFLVFGYLDLGPSVSVEKYHGVRGGVALTVTETSGEHGDADTTHRSQQTATFLVGQVPRGYSARRRDARRSARTGVLSFVHTVERDEASA